MAEKELLENITIEKLLQILASEYESIYLVDVNNNSFVPYKMAAHAASKYGGYFKTLPSYEEAIQKYINDYVSEEDLLSMIQNTSIAGLKQNFSRNRVFIQDFISLHNDGKKHYRFKATHIDTPEDEFLVVLGFADVGFQKEKELEHYAYNDIVTGGYNYNYFKEQLAQIEQNGFLVSMDIRSFKIINKVCGVKVGDIVIKAIYKSLSEILSKINKTSLQGRINADHFVFYIESVDKAFIEEILNQITIEMVNLSSKMKTPQLIPYFGITIWSSEKTVELVYSEANTAKHEVKENSEFNYAFYSENDANRLLEQKEMEDSFEAALKDKEFEIWYQKKCNPFSGIMTGAEALIRWRKKDGTLLSPGVFIPLFEKDGLIRQLDEYVFREVCRQQKEWLDKGLQIVPVSVNVSRASLYFWDVVDVYKKITDEFNLATKYVPIEITESATIGNSDIREIVKCFSKAGFSLHMDDFGTGYSSLATLNMMHFDALKLDKSLIDFIGDYSGDRLLEHTISLAKDLGMTVIAEGVEKQEQIDFLVRHACDSIQGYYFAKPQPVVEFEKNMELRSNDNIIEDLPSVYIATDGNSISDNIYFQAMDALIKTFHKILKVNLTTDTYEIVKFYSSENNEMHGFEPTFEKWVRSLSKAGMVYKDDIDVYSRIMNVEYLRKAFSKNHNKITLRYRRKIKDEFRWVMVEIIPAREYTPRNQIVMLYIQDIQDSYTAQLENQRELEKFCNTDTLTNLFSLYYYRKVVRQIAIDLSTKSVGLVFADLNGLKIVNDTYSHKAGNELICRFAKKISNAFGKQNCFRISGDEFVILLQDISREKFVSKVEEFYANIKQDLIPMAAMGWEWTEDITIISDLLSIAEKNMYREKQLFYKLHPEYSRDAVEKNYQQEVTSVIQALSEQYYILGMVDLRNNSYKLYKNNLPKSQQINFSTYSEYVRFIAEKRSTAESYSTFLKFSDINWIKEKLRQDKTFRLNIAMKSGHTYTFTLILCEDENGEPVKMIFSAIDAATLTDEGFFK